MSLSSKRRLLVVESLEGRALLSGLMVGGTNGAAVIVHPPVTPPRQTTLTLSGTITGNYISPAPHLPPGVDTFVPLFKIYQLSGNGPITITPPGGNPVTLSAEGSVVLPTTTTTTTIQGMPTPVPPIFPEGGFLTLSQKPTPIATGSTDLSIAPGNALFLELSTPTTGSSGKIEFHFKIVGGLGSYLGAKGTGMGVLTLTPGGSGGTTASITPVGPPGGTFSLTLSPPTTGTA